MCPALAVDYDHVPGSQWEYYAVSHPGHHLQVLKGLNQFPHSIGSSYVCLAGPKPAPEKRSELNTHSDVAVVLSLCSGLETVLDCSRRGLRGVPAHLLSAAD